MKLHYKNSNLFNISTLFLLNLVLISCGSYQNVDNNDGIYSDTRSNQEQKPIVIVEKEQAENYEHNYFTKELERLNSLNDSDIFLDADSYYSGDNLNDEEYYEENSPWGYEENDVVVNINLVNDPFWGGFNTGWGWYNPWGVNYWNYRGWYNPYWGNRVWVYNPYWGPYYNSWGWGPRWRGNPYWNNWGWNNMYYNNRVRYGRRANSSVTGRRSYYNPRYNVASSRRNTTSRYSNNRYSSTSNRRATSSRNSSSNRRTSPNTRSNSRTKSSSSMRRGNSSNSSRSYNKSSSRSSSKSYKPSRSSSSRSSSTRSRSSSRSSSTRSSGSTRSSRSRRS